MSDTEIPVTARLRLMRDSLASDAQGARADIEAAFAGMEIPLGAKLAESAEEAAPQITRIIADAVAGGAAQGGEAIQLTAQNVTMPSQAAPRAAAPPEDDDDGGGGGIGRDLGLGGMGLGRMFSVFMALRAARSGTEFAENMANDEDAEMRADELPTRTDSQRVARAKAEVAAYKKEEEDESGLWGGLQTLWSSAPWGSGVSWRDVAEENEKNAEIDESNAQANENMHRFAVVSGGYQNSALAAGKTGEDQKIQEVQNRYTEDLQKLRDAYDQTGGRVEDLVAAEKALAETRDASIKKIKDAAAVSEIQAGAGIIGSIERLQGNPDKAALDEYAQSRLAGRFGVVEKYGADSKMVGLYDQETNLHIQELRQAQDRKNEGRDFDTERSIGDSQARIRESGLRGQGKDFDAQLDAEKQAGADRVAALREEARLAADVNDNRRFLAEASALKAANLAELNEKQAKHNQQLEGEHESSLAALAVSAQRIAGHTEAADDSEMQDRQRREMQELRDRGGTADEIADLKKKQNAEINQRDAQKRQETADIGERTKELNLEASGQHYAADRSRIQYEYQQKLKEAEGDPDRVAALKGEEAAELRNVHPARVEMSSGIETWMRMQQAGPMGNAHADALGKAGGDGPFKAVADSAHALSNAAHELIDAAKQHKDSLKSMAKVAVVGLSTVL